MAEQASVLTLTLIDPYTEEQFKTFPTKEDYDKILAGDDDLANTYMQDAREKKNRLLAMQLVLKEKKLTLEMGDCCKSVQSPQLEEPKPSSPRPQSALSEDTESDTGGTRWSDKDIKYLIELYRENESKCNNPKFKVKNVWMDISLKIKNHNWEQCQNKFKNLKKTYKRIVDNKNSTGRGKMDWPYFQPMDEISSSSGFTSQSLNTEIMEPEGPCTNKRKRSTTSEPAWFKAFREDQERRLQERMQTQNEFLSLFREYLKK